MESSKNIDPFNEVGLLPRINKVVHFLLDHIQYEGLSDHANSSVSLEEQFQLDLEEQAYKGW